MATGGGYCNDVTRCQKCGTDLTSVDGDPSLRYCSACDKVLGLDDTCDQFELMKVSETSHFRFEVGCSRCGNDIANDFHFHTGHNNINLIRCTCGEVFQTLKESDEEIQTDQIGSFECPKCLNTTDDLFERSFNPETGRLYKIKCLSCGHGNTNKENAPNSCRERTGSESTGSSAVGDVASSAWSYVCDAVSSVWSFASPLVQEESAKVASKLKDNINSGLPATQGLNTVVRRAGNDLFVNLAGRVGQAVFRDSPETGMKVGVFVANQIANLFPADAAQQQQQQQQQQQRDGQKKQTKRAEIPKPDKKGDSKQ